MTHPTPAPPAPQALTVGQLAVEIYRTVNGPCPTKAAEKLIADDPGHWSRQAARRALELLQPQPVRVFSKEWSEAWSAGHKQGLSEEGTAHVQLEDLRALVRAYRLAFKEHSYWKHKQGCQDMRKVHKQARKAARRALFAAVKGKS